MLPPDDRQDRIAQAVERIARAQETRVPCAAVRDLIGTGDLDAAYLVQQGLVQGRLASGANVVGRKIGATSLAVQQQLGVDRPDFGYLLDVMDVSHDDPIPMDTLLQPRVEAEVAFVLGSDLDGDLTPDSVRAAVAYAVPALEIVDSRIDGWDITFTDTVADNASSGLFAIGDDRKTLDECVPKDVVMSLTVNGEERSAGTGEACLGDPLHALLWLATQARDFGDPLRAGQLVLSGALGPFVPFESGDAVTASITTLGSISVTFK
jgi:2-keto-4-pentenoate hydratase